MKVAIINTSDIIGGAAKAAYRLHKSLIASGVKSQMLVQIKKSDDHTVIPIAINKLNKGINFLRPFIDQLPVQFYKNKSKTHFSPSWFGFNCIAEIINEINPDIVHLHWICVGMVKIEEIAKINAPIVWSLHDMWAFTGGCHYDEECGRYLQECGSCTVLRSSKEKDLSRRIFLRKQKAFNAKKEMTIVGLSQWLNECSKTSTLLKNKRHINLPNPIDTTVFKPFDKKKSRELWSLPQNKKLVLFGAIGATADPRKGFIKLSEAFKKLTSSNIELIVFGSGEPINAPDFGFKTHYLGTLHDDVSLITLYSAADVMVVPSLQENLSNTILESLSCGTPVAAFDIGGNSDMIEHQQTGYLAKPFESKDLADGIQWVLNNQKYRILSNNARNEIVKKFDSKHVVQQYIALYEEILKSS